MSTKVLFLCTGNSARSQMAEAFLRKFGGRQFEARSAGITPKGINPLTVQVMEEIGFDLSRQRSKGVEEYLGKVHFHYLITLCDDAEQNCPRIWPEVIQPLHWSFEDPAAFAGTEAEKLDRFRLVRDQIEARILAWLFEIRQPAGELTGML
jgi:arsenate reductase (thioredoxin)